MKTDVGKSTKRIAKQAVKQMAREPFEILKQAGRQVSGPRKPAQPIPRVEKRPGVSLEEETKIKTQGKRQIQALEAEIEEIRRQKKVKEKQRLKQDEIEGQEEKREPKPFPAVSSRPLRKIKGGIKGKLQRLKRKTEIRIPPSG